MAWWSMWKGVSWHHALKSPFLPAHHTADVTSDSEEDDPISKTNGISDDLDWYDDDNNLEDVDVQMMEWELESDSQDANEIESLLVSLHLMEAAK